MSGRLILARALVVLGVLLATFALLAIYVRTTVLDDNEARSLAHALIARPDLRADVAATTVDRLYANVDVAALMRRELPAGQKSIAAPLAAALRPAAQQSVNRLLEEPTVQALWTGAVYQAHRQLVAVVENKRPSLVVSGGRAVLDLRPLLLRAGDRIGIGDRLAAQLPVDAGRITVLRSGDLTSAQRAIRALNFVANWFWVLAVGAWAGALALARGARGRVLRGIAAGLVAAGVTLLAVRALVGHWVVHSLVSAEWARPAVSTAWAVVTARLSDSAWTTIGVGVVALLGLWLHGSRHARRVRALLAPLLRTPELGYGGLVALLGLLFWWGPTVETRELRGIVLIAVGALAGFEALRRSTAREFPAVGLEELWESVRDRLAPAADEVDRLERLARLHTAGDLSDDEFAAAKRTLLAPVERAPL